MEALTRMVADSLARHGLERPIDPRRLQWSRWLRCDSTHSLLVVPSKPGIFALAEEIMDLGTGNTHVGTAADAGTSKTSVGTAPQACPERSRRGCPAEQSSAAASTATIAETTAEGSSIAGTHGPVGGAALQRCDSAPLNTTASAAEVPERRLLAVLQFSEDDDMAFTLDRMFTRINPMRDRLSSGRCFLRFVVIDDQAQRRSICSALNQWILSSAQKATGLPPDFCSSLEFTRVSETTRSAEAPGVAKALRVAETTRAAEATRVGAGDSPAQASPTTRVGRTLPSTSSGQALSDSAISIPNAVQSPQLALKSESMRLAPVLDTGAAKNLHCPHPLPSGF